MNVPRVVGSFALFVALVGAGRSASGPPLGGRDFAAGRASQPVAAHLYVADTGANAIFRFPLKNGLPAPYPDAMFSGIFLGTSFVSLDGKGRVYGNDLFGGGYFVGLDSPGGHFINLLNVGYPPLGMTTDAAGDIFTIVGSAGNTVFVYENFKPTVVAVLFGDSMSDLFVGPNQKLYAMAPANGRIDVYDHPTASASGPSAYIMPPNSNGRFTAVGAADENGQLVTTYEKHAVSGVYDANDFDVITFKGGSASTARF